MTKNNKSTPKKTATVSGRLGNPLTATGRIGRPLQERVPGRFVLLPPRGTTTTLAAAPGAFKFLTALDAKVGSGKIGRPLAAAAGLTGKAAALLPAGLEVLASIHENGAKLVKLADEQVSQLRACQPGIRIVPVVLYRPALAPLPAVLKKATDVPGVKRAEVKKLAVNIVTRDDTSTVVPGATVVAFTDFENGIGAKGTTNAKGIVHLTFPTATVTVERLYVLNEHTWWDSRLDGLKLKNGTEVAIERIDLAAADALVHFCGRGEDDDGAKVTVGVLDTGCGPHRDLKVDGGENTVDGEDPADFGTSGHPHGTHVAGIIAGKGMPPGGMRGVAPGVKLMSYRVFGAGAEGAENFAIALAIDRAVQAGCDLLNLSLGGGDPDPLMQSALADARAAGTVAIIAAGNDGRQPVSFPGSDERAVAVSALGRKGTFPATASALDEIMVPAGDDAKDFIAAFSNVGPEIDLTGPGVGIVSTVFEKEYAAFNGTSMACPAVTGLAARLLAGNPGILNMPRNQARSDAIIGLVLQAAKSLGFPAELEGRGLPG
jgi:subtilisin